MAPRRRRPKVGLTRMHAALDAMRPMGFSPAVVRKCLKNLLKVYGDDGWAFIEDSAYRVLIDTILEEPEVPQLENAPDQLLLEGGTGHVSYEQLESVPQLCDKEVVCEEKECVSDIHDEAINNGQEENQEQDLAIEVAPMPLQEDVKDRCARAIQLCWAPSYSPCPQSMGSIPTSRKSKPCYGWISDDEGEDDDFLQLVTASNIDN